MAKKLGLLLFLLVLLPGVFAATEINVKTIDHHDVTIVLREPVTQYQLIKSYNVFSGIKGEATVVYEGDKTKFHIQVFVKKDGQLVVSKLFESQTAIPVIELEVLPEGYVAPTEEEETTTEEPVEQVTEDSEAQVTEETTENAEESTGVTGFSFLGDSLSKIPNVAYIILLVLIIGVIGFFVFRRMRSSDPPHVAGPVSKKPRPTKSRKEATTPAEQSVSGDLGAIEEAERKIKEAQAEINRIKNKSRIEAAERKIREDQDALERLKRGEDLSI